MRSPIHPLGHFLGLTFFAFGCSRVPVSQITPATIRAPLPTLAGGFAAPPGARPALDERVPHDLRTATFALG